MVDLFYLLAGGVVLLHGDKHLVPRLIVPSIAIDNTSQNLLITLRQIGLGHDQPNQAAQPRPHLALAEPLLKILVIIHHEKVFVKQLDILHDRHQQFLIDSKIFLRI